MAIASDHGMKLQQSRHIVVQFHVEGRMRTWLRYALQRLDYAWQVGYKVGHSGTPFIEAWKRLTDDYRSGHLSDNLTEALDLTGVAMCPALNPKAEEDHHIIDHLLLRRIPFPSIRNCHIGDVVAFNSPYSYGDIPSVLVRRIAAMPGDQMLSDSRAFEPFLIPDDHCWVLADNDKHPPSHIIDSRCFGPLPLSSIRGRIIYSAYSSHDHGAVSNSPESMRLDDVLLYYELNLGQLLNQH